MFFVNNVSVKNSKGVRLNRTEKRDVYKSVVWFYSNSTKV